MSDRKRQRRRSRRKEARPAEIIEAGLREFARRGYAAAKLDDVAKRAGVSKATIYVYFKDKSALFEACMRSRLGPFVAQAQGMVDSFEGSTEELLRLLIPALHDLVVNSEAWELLRIVIAESGNFPFLAELHHRETVSHGKAIMEKIVARGIARGELRQGDFAAAPLVMAGPAIMAALWMMLFQRLDPIDAEKFAAAHLDLVLHGILRK